MIFKVSKRTFATMKIYTRTGDKGTSQLFSGERRPKTDPVFHALGAVDEANSMIGLSKEFLFDFDHLRSHPGATPKLQKLSDQLDTIMSRMFDVGTCIATPLDSSSASKLKRAKFDEGNVDILERQIDEMDLDLTPLKNFILPSGGKCAAHFHFARTITRKAEREVMDLMLNDKVEPSVGKYLNRLSDYLFTAARFVALLHGYPETIYKKQQLPAPSGSEPAN